MVYVPRPAGEQHAQREAFFHRLRSVDLRQFVYLGSEALEPALHRNGGFARQLLSLEVKRVMRHVEARAQDR